VRLKILFLFVFLFTWVQADTLRPAYLEVIQKSTEAYTLFLKVPAEKEKKLSLKVKPIAGCEEKGVHIVGLVNDSTVDRVTR